MNIALAYDNYCDRQYAALHDDDEALAEMIDTLTAGEYNANKWNNAMEAMGEEPVQQMAWQRAMQGGDLLLAGEIIKTVSENYWLKRAEQDAPARLAELRASNTDF